MSSLYYQHRQHEQQHQHQHYRYHPQHDPSHSNSQSQSQSQSHSHSHSHVHHQDRQPHQSRPNYPTHHQYEHQDYSKSRYDPHCNEDKVPTPEHDYATHTHTDAHATANHGNANTPGDHLRPSFRQTQAEILDTLAAKISLEFKNYCLDNYFPPEVLPPGPGLPRQQNVIRAAWREKICQWSYNVVDHYKLPREIVSISLNYFDRYMATLSTAEGSTKTNDPSNPGSSSGNGNESGDLALLASLGTLHLATKVHLTNHNDYDPELGPLEDQHYKIPGLQSLATLSRGQFGPESIIEMEKILLRALEWKLHPPTLFALMNSLLELIPTLQDDPVHGIKKSIRDELFEMAMYLAELSVCDVFFVERQIPASTIALAAVCTAIENLYVMMRGPDADHLRGVGSFCEHHHRRFVDTCRNKLGLGGTEDQFRQAWERLVAIHKGAEDAGHLNCTEAETETESKSPTNPHEELQQRQRSNSYNPPTNSYSPPTSPLSIAEMSTSMATSMSASLSIHSCINSMADATLGDNNRERDASSNPNAKRADSFANSSMSIPTRNESMVSSIDCHTSGGATRTSSMMTTDSCLDQGTPDRGGDQTSNSCNNSSKNFLYSPSPKREDDSDVDVDIDREIVLKSEDPRIAVFRGHIEASLVVTNNNDSNHHRCEIYYHDSHHDEQLQPQDDSYRTRRTNCAVGTAMMSISPVALR